MTDPNAVLLILSILVVTSSTCMGLLAQWATTSSRHWLLRTAAVLAGLSPLLLIPAYEPWAQLALQACTVAAGITIRRWRAARRLEGSKSEDAVTSQRRFTIRFTIRTLLAMACLVALLAPIIAPLAEEMRTFGSWKALVVSGVCGGLAVLIGAWLGTAKRKWPAWLAASLLCLGLASVAAWFDLWFSVFVMSQPRAAWAWFVIAPVLAAITWLLLRVWFAGGATPVGSFGTARRIVARSFLCLLLVVLALPPAYVAWELIHPLPVPNLPVPQPNGLDDIVAAGKAFGTSPILSAGIEPKSTEELAAEVAKHAGDYQRLRLGLTRDIRAQAWAKDGEILDPVALATRPNGDVRQAARGLMRESQLAQQQQRYGDAARIALDNVQMGRAVTRNGLIVDYLTGVAVEWTGAQSLYQVLPNLDANECCEMIAALAEVERRREPVDDVLHRERACSENMFGWMFHFQQLLTDITSTRHEDLMLRVRNREQAATRLLITELALRAYLLEHNELPDRLEQLTPDFLKDLPVDPFDPDGRPLRYVRTDDRRVLYSVGADGKDDSGRTPEQNRSDAFDPDSDGDLRLDMLFAPDDDPHEVPL